MYGRNNIYGTNNNNSYSNGSYNNGSSNRNYGNYNYSSNYSGSNNYGSNNYGNNNYSGNNYSGNQNNDRIGSLRTNYKYEEPPSYLTAIIDVWKQYPPLCITAREELLHLSPIETRVEDYFLIRNKQLHSLQEDKLREAIRKDCFNEELLKNSCYNLMPFSRENPLSLDAVKALAKRAETSYGTNNNNNYGNSSYSNNNYGNNGNNSLYNTRSNNIFSNNNNSGNNSYSGNNYGNSSNNYGNSSSNNIFSRNSNTGNGSNNIFSNNNSGGNSSSNNIFSGSSNSNNIFSRNSNGNNYGSNNNNGGNNSSNNGASSNIFSRNNNSAGSNIFNNNNGGSNNSIFSNNNGNNANRNIFSNNNANSNIFNNNNNGNSMFNNGNGIFNNGNSVFNNGNNGNNSLFNNNANYNPYSQQGVDPRFFTELQAYMKNVNEVVRKLNGSLPQPFSAAAPSETSSIFSESSRVHEPVDPYEMESYFKKKSQEQEVFVSARYGERSNNGSRISNNPTPSTIEDATRSQILENSQFGGQRLRNSYMNHSKMRTSSISNNDMKGSKISANQTHFEKKQVEKPMSISAVNRPNLHFNAEAEIEESTNIKKSRLFHEVYDAPCQCQMKLVIVWTGIDPKRCEQLPGGLTVLLKLDRLLPNSKEWRQNTVRNLKNQHPVVRIDAQLVIADLERLEEPSARFVLKGELHQRLFNLDPEEYDVSYRNVKKGLAYNLSISNQFGHVSWDFPVDVTNLEFAEGGEFSIQNNAIICQKEPLNCKCHVTFRRLPEKIKAAIANDGGDTTNAKKTLEGWVSKISEGKFQLDEIWMDQRTDETGWSMTVSKFL